LLGAADVATFRQIVDCPEAADAESAFGSGQAVVVSVVSIKQPFVGKLTLDPLVGTTHSNVAGVPVANAGHKQQGCVRFGAVELAHIASQCGIEPASLDCIFDRPSCLTKQ